jgi:hypothetical protein
MVCPKETDSRREALLPRGRRWRPLAALLPFLLLSACGGTPMSGAKPPPNWVGMAQPQPAPSWIKMAQYQPIPAPRSMAPPPAPARPPSPNTQNFGHWQQEGNIFKWTPGQHPGPAPGPIWVPGHWFTDSSGNKVWSPGYWR